jgi:translation initiation factor IF-3
LIGPEGEQIGIVPTSEALARAREAGLDLVEVSPTSRPPVCRILDYGKYKYDQAKKQAQSRKKQHVVSIKGMRFRPKIEEHDYQFKMRHVREFLEEGNKVKCFVLFRGREKAHTEFGSKIMDRLAADLNDIAIVESASRLEGNSMTMLLNPRPGGAKKSSTARPKPEKKAVETPSPADEPEPESEPESESEMRPHDEA